MACRGFSSKTAKQSRKSKQILNELRPRLSPSGFLRVSLQNAGNAACETQCELFKKETRTGTFFAGTEVAGSFCKKNVTGSSTFRKIFKRTCRVAKDAVIDAPPIHTEEGTDRSPLRKQPRLQKKRRA
jgi:hypothetical protein